MEALDTVMSEDNISSIARSCGNEDYGLAIAEAQVEITFPIAFKAGIKEVVEWIRENHYAIISSNPRMEISDVRWQAQLKKWGIK